MKSEIRVIGIDDAPFDKNSKKQTLVVGSIFRGNKFLEGVVSTKVAIDGNNATQKISEMIKTCKFLPQLRCIFLDGIAVGGFNVIDIEKLHTETDIPVIVVVRKRPDVVRINQVLKKLGKEKQIRLLEKAGNIIKLGSVYGQVKGVSVERAQEFLKISCARSLIPEAIRYSHLIASGVVTGESKGKP